MLLTDFPYYGDNLLQSLARDRNIWFTLIFSGGIYSPFIFILFYIPSNQILIQFSENAISHLFPTPIIFSLSLFSPKVPNPVTLYRLYAPLPLPHRCRLPDPCLWLHQFWGGGDPVTMTTMVAMECNCTPAAILITLH